MVFLPNFHEVPPVAERFCPQNWLTGGVGFIDLAFGSFHGLLRKSSKYGLGFLRKSPRRPMSHMRTIGLNPTTQPNQISMNF